MPFEVDLDGHCAAIFISEKLDSGHGCIVLQMMAPTHPAAMFRPCWCAAVAFQSREPVKGSLYSGRSITRDKLITYHTAR